MQTVQALSNETLINPNYRRLYKTTTTSCECPSNFHSKYICKHIRLERFIQKTNRTVLKSISTWRSFKNQESAIKIRLSILKNLLNDDQALIASPFEMLRDREEAAIRAFWLKPQIKQLEKRVSMIERLKPSPAPAPKKQCEHKHTENRNSMGNREIRIYCLDCHVFIHSEWSMSC